MVSKHHLLTVMAALLLCSCGQGETRPPGLTDCTGGCSTSGGTGATPQPEAGLDADASDAATAPITGTVVVFQDTSFSETELFQGTCRVYVPTSGGQEAYEVGGDAGVAFLVEDALVGPGWFTVVPDSVAIDAGLPGTFLVPTWSRLTVPAGGSASFTVPLINRTFLNSIYLTLATPTTPKGDSVQVIVAFERDGLRVPGIQLTESPSSEALLYDVGVGYSENATVTGGAGVAILVNTTGLGEVKWQGQDSEDSFDLSLVAGQVGFVRVDVS